VLAWCCGRCVGDAGFSGGQPGPGGLLQQGDAAAGTVRAASPGRPVSGHLRHGEPVGQENLLVRGGWWTLFSAARCRGSGRRLALP